MFSKKYRYNKKFKRKIYTNIFKQFFRFFRKSWQKISIKKLWINFNVCTTKTIFVYNIKTIFNKLCKYLYCPKLKCNNIDTRFKFSCWDKESARLKIKFSTHFLNLKGINEKIICILCLIKHYNHYQKFRSQQSLQEKKEVFFLSIKIGFGGQKTEAKGEHILVHTPQSLRLTLKPFTFHRSKQLFAPFASGSYHP